MIRLYLSKISVFSKNFFSKSFIFEEINEKLTTRKLLINKQKASRKIILHFLHLSPLQQT